MSTYIGNQVNSIQVTESSIQLNCDSQAAVTLQIGTQNIDMHGNSFVNAGGFASEISMNSYKITDLGVATSNGDALSRQAGDGRYYLNTTPLDDIVVPADSLDMNNKRIINLDHPQSDYDALNRYTGDGRYYLNNVPLNNITMAAGAVFLNSNKITSLADPTNAQDAATKNYADSNFYANTTTLNSIALATGDIDANSQYIINLATPISSNDAVNKHYVDSGFYTNTTALNDLTVASGNLSLNSNRIINLAQPVGNNDAATKTYIDSNFYASSTPINSLQAPTGDLSLNSYKITNLATATAGSDALNRDAADSRYYQNTVTLDGIELATSALDLNTQRISNLGEPLNAQDASTKSYVDNAVNGALSQTTADARYYLNTVTLDAIELPVLEVDMNAQKIVNLQDPASAQDGATKIYVDTQIANLVDSAPGVIDTLNELAAALGNDPNFATTMTNLINEKLAKAGDTMSGDLNMGSNHISNLAAPIDNSDATNKHYVDTQVATALTQTQGDSRYYLNTTALNDITAPTNTLDMDFHGIQNLANPVGDQDAATKHYVVNGFYSNTTTLNSITAPSGDLSLASNKITNLLDPTNAQDGATKAYVDSQIGTSLTQTQADARYYLNTTTLDQVAAPTGDLSVGGQRITNVANPSANTDAMNKQTADSSYYGSATTLNNIEAPNGDVSMNSNKITDLAPATNRFDAMTLSQDLRWHWVNVDFTADVTSFTNPMVLMFDVVKYATLTDVSQLLFWDTDGITLSADHFYLVQIQLELEYTGGVNVPAVAQIRLADGTTVLKQFTTNRAPALNTPQLTSYQFVFSTTQQETIKLWLTNTANLSKIIKNTNFMVTMLA